LGVPIFPINLGAVGFLAGISPDDWKPAFERCLSGGLAYSKRLMLEVAVERQGSIVAQGCCLNDAVVSASGIAKVIRFTVKAGGVGEAAVFLGLYRADGLIAATPTGSTAYSVAAGGPILDPEMEAVIINPICPFTLSNRPLVLPAADTVIIEVDSEQRSGVLLTLDGQETKPLEPGDRILIRRAPYSALLAEADRQGFYRALRTKLS
jgi:NAD+ kinase